MPRCEDHKVQRLFDLPWVKGLWRKEGEGGMRIIFCLGVGVFFYGTFFGGEASKKSLMFHFWVVLTRLTRTFLLSQELKSYMA